MAIIRAFHESNLMCILCLCAVFHVKGTRESPRPKAGSHGRDSSAPQLPPPPPPPPPPLLRERSERAEAREHAREQALARASASNGLPPRRAAEELRKQVLKAQSVAFVVFMTT